MKTIDANNLYQTLNALLNSGQMLPSKFLFRAARNLNILKPLAEAYAKVADVNNNTYLKDYSQARINTLESICVKNSIGQPLSHDGKYVFEPANAGDVALAKLNLQYPDLQVHLNKFNQDLQEVGAIEEDIPLLMVKEEQLPETLPANIMLALIFMIEP